MGHVAIAYKRTELTRIKYRMLVNAMVVFKQLIPKQIHVSALVRSARLESRSYLLADIVTSKTEGLFTFLPCCPGIADKGCCFVIGK